MGDISDGVEQTALDSLEEVDRIQRKLDNGKQLTKRECFVHYGVWDTEINIWKAKEKERKFKAKILCQHMISQWSDEEIDDLYYRACDEMMAEQQENREAYD